MLLSVTLTLPAQGLSLWNDSHTQLQSALFTKTRLLPAHKQHPCGKFSSCCWTSQDTPNPQDGIVMRCEKPSSVLSPVSSFSLQDRLLRRSTWAPLFYVWNFHLSSSLHMCMRMCIYTHVRKHFYICLCLLDIKMALYNSNLYFAYNKILCLPVTMWTFPWTASSRFVLSIKEYFLHVTIVNGNRRWYLLLAGRSGSASTAISITAEVELYPGTCLA